MAVVALTGGTGFVGRHVAAALREAGHEVRALARRPDPGLGRDGLRVVPGSLEDEASLALLVRGADAVVHAAGAVRAPGRAAFRAANADGTARLAGLAAAEPGCRRFVLVSSLAARRPDLSGYAESKASGERAAARLLAGRADLTVVRPPAVYGPGDRATLPLLRGLSRGWLVAPASGAARFSLLFAGDLARLVAALLAPLPRPGDAVIEPDDGRPGGYGWRDLAALAEAALGRRVRVVGVPKRPLAALGGLLDLLARAGGGGRAPALSRGKVEELFHPDWVCDTRGLAAAAPGWRPAVGFGAGLLGALAWYRAQGWM